MFQSGCNHEAEQKEWKSNGSQSWFRFSRANTWNEVQFAIGIHKSKVVQIVMLVLLKAPQTVHTDQLKAETMNYINS